MTEHIGISLGWNCHSSVWGVENNIRARKENGYQTCPFDIMVTNYVGICECINDDFKHLCDEKYLEMIKVSDAESTIYNNKYNFVFNHESPGHANLYLTENWEHGTDHYIINNYENLKNVHGYDPVVKGPLTSVIEKIKTEDKKACTYNCDEFPIIITLLHTEKNTSDTYQPKGSIIHALETFQTIINFKE